MSKLICLSYRRVCSDIELGPSRLPKIQPSGHSRLPQIQVMCGKKCGRPDYPPSYPTTNNPTMHPSFFPSDPPIPARFRVVEPCPLKPDDAHLTFFMALSLLHTVLFHGPPRRRPRQPPRSST